MYSTFQLGFLTGLLIQAHPTARIHRQEITSALHIMLGGVHEHAAFYGTRSLDNKLIEMAKLPRMFAMTLQNHARFPEMAMTEILPQFNTSNDVIRAEMWRAQNMKEKLNGFSTLSILHLIAFKMKEDPTFTALEATQMLVNSTESVQEHNNIQKGIAQAQMHPSIAMGSPDPYIADEDYMGMLRTKTILTARTSTLLFFVEGVVEHIIASAPAGILGLANVQLFKTFMRDKIDGSTVDEFLAVPEIIAKIEGKLHAQKAEYAFYPFMVDDQFVANQIAWLKDERNASVKKLRFLSQFWWSPHPVMQNLSKAQEPSGRIDKRLH